MENSYLFTSESVSMGHPDKIADQISDAVLDALLEQDPHSRVACETMVTTGLVVLAGEVTTNAYVDLQHIVRQTIKEIGYTSSDIGFDYRSCAVLISLDRQSPDISQGVTRGKGLHSEQGAGDQGMMFGYACSESKELMPLPILLSHKLVAKLAEVRQKGVHSYLRPDAKSQVTVEYSADQPKRVHTVVVSTQHDERVKFSTLKKDMIQIIRSVIPRSLMDSKTVIHVNPTGRFVVGGPKGDCGLTGRKIIVDTYGGMGRHGGGAFSGKDPSKVDRSATYMARYVAKNIVAAKLAKRCEVQFAYAIGVAEPVSVKVDSFNTGVMSDDKLGHLVRRVFGLKPAEIIRHLDLKKPRYRHTAYHGHFGRSGKYFTWEKTDQVQALKKAAKKMR